MRTIFACALFSFVAAMVPNAAFAAGGTQIVGRVLDASGGLPIADAAITLEHGKTAVSDTKTDSDGAFSFADVQPGVYNILVTANGYQPTTSADLFIVAGEAQAKVSLALNRAGTGLRTISNVHVTANASLQTTATFNQNINPAVIQAQGYIRSGDALATLPFVNGQTSSSMGDDLALSIRGFDPTENETLIDGHPIGPIGAYGQGYDYQISPFWGLSNMEVVYGSGATGLYNVPTVSGAINFQTLNPTRTPQFSVEQGYGTFAKALTGVTATGTAGKLGYALAYGVQGTQGELTGNITQWGMLANPNSYGCPTATSVPTVAASDVSACSYYLNGDYLLRNAMGKLTYDVTPTTNLGITFFNQTMYAYSPGNGDTDYVTYPYLNYTTQNSPPATSITLPNGNTVSCNNNTYPVANNSSAGYECLTAGQYASTFYGPQGGGPGRYHDGRNSDYHARITQQLGPTQLILDGYVDSYGFDNIKGFTPTSNHFTDLYYTHGFLASDEYAVGKNDVTGGVFLEHQQHLSNNIGAGTTGPDLQLTFSNYFLKDTWQPNTKLNVFADVEFQRDQNTATTFTNPRLSIVYRPTTDDVIRVTGGRSASVPDPSNLYGTISFGSVQSYNPTCGQNLDSIASGNNPTLQPESATDYELAYGHRFGPRAVFQADLYDSTLQNPLISGTFPLSTVPANEIPDLTSFIGKLQGVCGSAFNASHFGVSDLFNAGSAKFQGMDFTASIPLGPQFTLNGEYAVQSAVYNGMNNNILVNNIFLINGNQIGGVPLQRADFGVGYADPNGWTGALDGYYIGEPNHQLRPGYTFFNFNIGKQLTPQLSANLGVLNVFNNAVSQYGLVGLGNFRPENQYGTDTSALQQGFNAEQFGLAPAQVWFTLTVKT